MTDTSAHPHATKLVVCPRPALHRWLDDRNIDDATAGQLFGCTKQFVNAMRRPFADPLRKRPGAKLLTRIVRVTEGAVRPEDFSPPVADILRGLAA